jgi:hypothetical protein
MYIVPYIAQSNTGVNAQARRSVGDTETWCPDIKRFVFSEGIKRDSNGLVAQVVVNLSHTMIAQNMDIDRNTPKHGPSSIVEFIGFFPAKSKRDWDA